MERLQITLLILISSSYFLTCETKSKKSKMAATTLIENTVSDSINVTKNNEGEIFSSAWLTLPFSGSGSNWIATINTPEIPQEILENDELNVYMKKNDSVFKLDYKNEWENIDHGIERNAITISSNFNPEGIEFRYIISRDGTFVKHNITDVNYTAMLK